MRWVAWLASAFAFAIYVWTMPPSLVWVNYGVDGGDLASALARGALPHPPGFPAYLLLGRLFAQLPFGELAWRLNLLSACGAAGAVGLTVATALRMGARASAALVAGLSLAFAPLLWSQAILVEVYAVAAFCAAFLFYLAARGAPGWARGLTLGIALGAHPTLIFLFPFVVSPRVSKQSLVAGLFSLLLGWLAMYALALPALNRAPSPWGDVGTLDGWWAFVSAKMYRGFAFALPLAELPARVSAFAVLLVQQFTPVGALIAVGGIISLVPAQRALAFVMLSGFALVTMFAIGYNTFDSLVYLTSVLPLCAFWLATGITNYELRITNYVLRFTPHAPRIIAILFLLLPFTQFALNYPALDLRENRTALQWAMRVLDDAPPHALMVTASDAHTFTLWYAREALHARPDVIVLDRDLWLHAPYRAMMMRVHDLPADFSAVRPVRPIIFISEDQEP